ncbi:MAG: hypothetical protein GF398_11265, partial [Chitinivibrionales bacterium]|nr:hypothetical protein [Chitinivibrionales bacterium]
MQDSRIYFRCMDPNATRFITNTEIYELVIRRHIANAGKFVWIGTADIKDLYIHKAKRMVPFLELLSELIAENVTIRLI